VRALCTNWRASQRFPNQGRAVPRGRHATKFGGALVLRATRCPADGSVKFTALAPAALPLEAAPGRQAEGSAACSHGASGSSGSPIAGPPGLGARDAPPASGADPLPSLRGVPSPSQLGGARLDTPFLSDRVKEAKNVANSGASEIRRQLLKRLVRGREGVADGPGRGFLRSDREDPWEHAKEPDDGGPAASCQPQRRESRPRRAGGRAGASLGGVFGRGRQRGERLPGR